MRPRMPVTNHHRW